MDFCGYGHYSVPGQFKDYLAEIVRKATDKLEMKVQMIVYDECIGKEHQGTQFNKLKFYDVTKSENFRRAFPDPATSPKTYDDFIEALLRNHLNYSGMLRAAGAQIRTTKTEVGMFLWIQDGKDAAFSFRVAKQLETAGTGRAPHYDAREFAFRTRDADLVRTFSEVFNRTWETASLPGSGLPHPSGL